MAIATYTNDADRQVAANLDDASLGLSYNDPSDSIFTTGKSAMGLLPEMMQLNQVMAARGQLNSQSRLIRKDLAEDEKVRVDQGVFDSYVKDMNQLAGIKDPVEKAQKLSDMNTSDPRRMLNKDVQESMKVLRDSYESVTKAGTSVAQSRMDQTNIKNADFIESQRENTEESSRLESGTRLEAARLNHLKQQALQTDANISPNTRYGSAIGQSSSLPPDVVSGLADLGGVFGNGAEAEPYLKAIGEIVGAHGMYKDIERSYSAQLTPLAGYFKLAGKNNLDLDLAATDGNQIAPTREALIVLRKAELKAQGQEYNKDIEEPRINKALSLNSSIVRSKGEFDDLGLKLKNLPVEIRELAKKARLGDEESKIELEGKMSKLSLLASKVGAGVQGRLKEELETKGRLEESYKLQKTFEELKSIVATRDRDDKKYELAVIKQEWLEKGRNVRELIQTLSAAKNTQAMKKLKDSQEYIDFVKDVQSGTTSSSGDSLF